MNRTITIKGVGGHGDRTGRYRRERQRSFCVLFVMSIVIDYVINSTRQSVQFLIFSRK